MTVYESKVIQRASSEEQRDLTMQSTVNELLYEWRKTPDASLGDVVVRVLGGRSPEEIEHAIKSLKEAQRKAEEEDRRLKKKAREDSCIHPAICMEWEESEAGWGVRPDGWSVHNSEEDCKQYVKEYWDSMPPRDANGNPPHEYSREGSRPYVALVNQKVFNQLNKATKEGKPGVRIFSYDDAPVIPSREKLVKMLRK